MTSLIRMACLAITVATSGHVQAAFIVNTGTPTENRVFSFGQGQYFAGEFAINNSYTLNTIEGYLSNDFSLSSGTVDVSLHSDGGVIPGGILKTQTFSLGASARMNWYGVSNLGWTLSQGTYWVSFKPTSGIAGGMQSGAPNPLSGYAFFSGFNSQWNEFNDARVGFRIDASSAPVPEPATMALFSVGALGMGFIIRRKKKLAN